jgi:predicted short-subunit dehydrogenase-like oxidoreductase (DUF2520 family)
MEYTVIGYGKLGKALSFKLLEIGHLKQIVSTHLHTTEDAEFFANNNVEIVQKVDDLNNLADIVLIAVADSDIEKVALQLEKKFSDALQNKIVIHCSGILSDEILSNLLPYGAITASSHPLQTFYNYHSNIFKGIFWVVQSKYFDKIQPILEEIGGEAIAVNFSEQERNLYHASAVVASNYLNSVVFIAKNIIAKSGLSPEVLLPLIQQTINNNIIEVNDKDSFPITGPIARRDFHTLTKHLDALQLYPEMKELYTLLSLTTAKICSTINILTVKDWNEMLNVFQQHESNKE